MTSRQPPRLALTLLQWLVADSAPLAGDLIEQFEARPSRAWFWWQVLVAIWIDVFTEPDLVRPLQLVDQQPSDAVERSRRWSLRFPPVNMTASPVYGAGGLGIVMLSLLLSLTVPAVWVVMIACMLAGVALGLVMIWIQRTRQFWREAHR